MLKELRGGRGTSVNNNSNNNNNNQKETIRDRQTDSDLLCGLKCSSWMSTATTNGAPLSSWQQSWLNKQQSKEVWVLLNTQRDSVTVILIVQQQCALLLLFYSFVAFGAICQPASQPFGAGLILENGLQQQHSAGLSLDSSSFWEREFVSSSSFAWLCLQISSCCCPLTKWPSWSTQTDLMAVSGLCLTHSLLFTSSFSRFLVLSALLCDCCCVCCSAAPAF